MTSDIPFGRRGARVPLSSGSRAPSPPPVAEADWSVVELGKLLFSFDGRIRRQTYWLAWLGVHVAMGILFIVLNLAAGAGRLPPLAPLIIELAGWWVIIVLQVKRWHDRNKSWPWLFIGFIPIVGWLWVLIEVGFLDGTPGPNRFGPSPKSAVGPQAAAAIV